jgi:hypothetical protein
MEPFSRSERRQLRELVGLAYERELGGELGRLEATFREWRAGQRSPHEVSAAIHAFHDGVARELYGLYTHADAAPVVARAIAIGLLGEGEVPAELRERLRGAVEFYRGRTAAEGAGAPTV